MTEYVRGLITSLTDHYQPRTGRRIAVLITLDHTPDYHALGLPAVVIVRRPDSMRATDRYTPRRTHIVAWGHPTTITDRNGNTLRAIDAWTISTHRPDRHPPHPITDRRATPPAT